MGGKASKTVSQVVSSVSHPSLPFANLLGRQAKTPDVKFQQVNLDEPIESMTEEELRLKRLEEEATAARQAELIKNTNRFRRLSDLRNRSALGGLLR